MTKVHVEQGWLEGELLDLVTGDGQYYSFKGIPYAAAPIGHLRFKAPQPPHKWDGIRKATSHGLVCHQKDIILKTEPTNCSEDCLFLNVYSPNISPIKPLPVMVFIHGGGFKSGSGDSHLYGPDFLIQEEVVLVTINYRLEVLGFLCLDIPEVSGNAGLKDQVAALKWVKNNISNFGGDPNNVTLFGESAGSVGVALHMMSPMSKNLFQRAILMSGVPFCQWSLPYQPTKRAFVLGKQLGLDTKDPYELLDYLQKVPVENLIDTNPCILISETIINNPLKMYHFTPVLEKNLGQDTFISEEPIDLLTNKNINDVDALLGYTSDEALLCLATDNSAFLMHDKYPELFVPRSILYGSSASSIFNLVDEIKRHYFNDRKINISTIKEFIKYATEEIFVYHVHKFIDLLTKSDRGKYYLYKFSAYSERNIFGNQSQAYNITGVTHLEDLLYIFPCKYFNLPINKDSKSYKMIKQTCALFTNFAKYGHPTHNNSPASIIWPEYDMKKKGYLDIGEELTIGNYLNDDIIKFWDKIYSKSCTQYGYYVTDKD